MTPALNSLKRGHAPYPMVLVFTDNPTLRPQPLLRQEKTYFPLSDLRQIHFFASLCTSRHVGFNSFIEMITVFNFSLWLNLKKHTSTVQTNIFFVSTDLSVVTGQFTYFQLCNLILGNVYLRYMLTSSSEKCFKKKSFEKECKLVAILIFPEDHHKQKSELL